MITVIIPTYKNKNFLYNLKKNLNYLKNNEIIIVNDNPEKSLKNELKNYKQIILLENKKNLGFGQSVNKAVNIAKNKYVLLLNDDVTLFDDNYKLALKYFQKESLLFAVSFAQKEKDGSIVGKNVVYWEKGLIFHQKAGHLSFGFNAWAEGGACMIDKDKFEKLKGFDSLYFPFYWEDIDLSYRAWKNGYHIYFDPKILVKHHHETTIGQSFTKTYVKTIAFRNQFFFIWKNITGISFVIAHWLMLPFNLLYYLLINEEEFFLGFIEALKKKCKIKKDSQTVLEDKQVLAKLKNE